MSSYISLRLPPIDTTWLSCYKNVGPFYFYLLHSHNPCSFCILTTVQHLRYVISKLTQFQTSTWHKWELHVPRYENPDKATRECSSVSPTSWSLCADWTHKPNAWLHSVSQSNHTTTACLSAHIMNTPLINTFPNSVIDHKPQSHAPLKYTAPLIHTARQQTHLWPTSPSHYVALIST